ncbi:MAG: sensor histidine kinase [Hyphomicrobiales bacterium]|nr:sensor histidine kinase [Hyphomicrobiales bacterium]
MTAETPDIGTRIGLWDLIATPARRVRLWWRGLRGRYSWVPSLRFRTISGRILVINIASFLVLLVGMLYLNDFRDQLIATRIQSLGIEARVVARALALENPIQETADVILGRRDSEITMERAAFLLNTLIKPDGNSQKTTNAYVYAPDGTWLADTSRSLATGTVTLRTVSEERRDVGWLYRMWLTLEGLLRRDALPEYRPPSFRNGKEQFPEVAAAIESGVDVSVARENEYGEAILTVAQPVKKGDVVIGAVLLISADGQLDDILAKTRSEKFMLGLLLIVVTVLASFFLAYTIAGPMHKLGQAAENVRRRINDREDIPDYSARRDEIGNLSRSLREMTSALYARLDAIESFAADVAHELKNPLTSMHSAMQTLPMVKKEEDREELMNVIRHDIDRLNRLITDISDASRLDVEMVKEKWSYFNIVEMLEAHIKEYGSVPRAHNAKVVFVAFDKTSGSHKAQRIFVHGHKGRLTQVISNLLDNAVSFSPENGLVQVCCRYNRMTNQAKIIVDDEGPGIPPANLNKIFERFYTDRPGPDQFGQNSGLGLNICRQIISAHRGLIRAENRTDPSMKETAKGKAAPGVVGARFVIRLPAGPRAS